MLMTMPGCGVRYEPRQRVLPVLDWSAAREGIVSKRLGSPYRSGRSAALGEGQKPERAGSETKAEEDWGR